VILGFVGAAELVPLLVFAGFVAGVWSILSLLSNRNSRATERLDRISRPASLAEIEDPRLKKERFQGMVEMAKGLSSPLMPQSEGEQSELRNRLANAGFRSESAVSVYLGIRFATLMVFFLLGAVIFLPRTGSPGTA
jgi:tight adherence protein C